jgi:hypothetical protein
MRGLIHRAAVVAGAAVVLLGPAVVAVTTGTAAQAAVGTTINMVAAASGTPGTVIPASSVGAELSGATGFAGGTITFTVFGPQSSPPAACTSGGTTVGTAAVSGGGGYHPAAGFTPGAAGTYWWYASYGGDATNLASDSGCGAGMPSTAVSAGTTASLTDSNGNPIVGAAVTFRSASGSVTTATTGSDGTAGVVLTPGTYSVTMYYANGYQTKPLSVTANGLNEVSFATTAVTAQISDPDSADLAAALVAHAGNTGTFGPKTAVDGNGQVTFQVLTGTNSFTAYDGSAYTKETLTITAATSTSISVT